LRIANKFSDLPEPDPFSVAEFRAWRGFLRAHAHVTGELDRRLRAEHDLPLEQFGILITLVGVPQMRLRMGELGARRLVSPSKISRAVDELEERGLIKRSTDPDDRRSYFAALTRAGMKKLRAAQVTHHAAIRELFIGPLSARQVAQLGEVLEAAVPGVVSSDVWPVRSSPSRSRASRLSAV
jgi:DNA-binding MarR family transcriptional regulator